MDALELAARYSFMPNKLRYCGPEDADKILFQYVIDKKDKETVERVLKQFEAFSLYLNLIAKKNKKSIFDKDVIEAYWIGNSLLEKVKKEDIKKLITEDFTKKGLPHSIAKKLAKNIPNNSTPHHSFHVMHIHSVTGKIKFMFSNIDKCRISWGKVKDINKNSLLIEYSPIEIKDKLILGKEIDTKVQYDKEFLRNIKINDFVAVHWNYAVDKLTKTQKQNLEKYTIRNINAINSLKVS